MFRRTSGAIGTGDHLMHFKNRMHLNRRRKNGNPKKIDVVSTKLNRDAPIPIPVNPNSNSLLGIDWN